MAVVVVSVAVVVAVVVEVVVAVVAVDSVVVVVVQVELSVTSGEILKSFEPTLNKPRDLWLNFSPLVTDNST